MHCGNLAPTTMPENNSKHTPVKSVVAKKAGNTIKKRTWKKPKGKPKRPLSAYNLFFQDEREKIVAAVALDTQSDSANTVKQAGSRNRRPRGKIGFANLARNIAAKWKVLDESSRSPYEERARSDKERYMAELLVWNEKQKSKKDEDVRKDLYNPRAVTPTEISPPNVPVQRQPSMFSNNYNERAAPSPPPSYSMDERKQVYPVGDEVPCCSNSGLSHMDYIHQHQADYSNPQRDQRAEAQDLINILNDASQICYDPSEPGSIQYFDHSTPYQQDRNTRRHDTWNTRRNSLFGILGDVEPLSLPKDFVRSMETNLTSQPETPFSNGQYGMKRQKLPPGTDGFNDDFVEMLSMIASD